MSDINLWVTGFAFFLITALFVGGMIGFMTEILKGLRESDD